MIFEQIPVGPMRNFAYLLGDEASGEAAVVDPGFEPERLATAAERRRLRVRWIVNTHSHHDHTGGNAFFRARGAALAAHASAPTRPDLALADGDVLRLGATEVRVLHTPGHSPDSICLVAPPWLLTGDTLFVGECGRVDLRGSDVRAMHHSLLTVIRGLPDDLVVMPGHDYGEAPSRTLGEEKRTNYTLEPRSLDDFIAFMAAP